MPTPILARPTAADCAPYYGRYTALVPPGDLLAILHAQLGELTTLLAIDDAHSTFAPAPDRWSLREVVGHLADVERILTYRALAFARGDRAPLPGFEPAEWNPAGRFHERPLPDLLAEWTIARQGTIAFARGLPAEALARRGSASDVGFTVLALLTILPGHLAHHIALLRRDWLPARR